MNEYLLTARRLVEAGVRVVSLAYGRWDWHGRPHGTNSFAHKPSAVIGASTGKLGTAIAQQNLRSVLGFCNSPQMNAPEAYIQFTPGLVTDEGEVTVESTEKFLRKFMSEYADFVCRVLTVLPRRN